MRNAGILILVLLLGLTGFFYLENRRLDQGVKAQVISHELTKANYRAALAAADAQDTIRLLNETQKRATNNAKILNDFEARLADLRLRAQRLQPPSARTSGGSASVLSVPSTSPASGGTAPTLAEAGLSSEDALIASEQAMQLQGLLDWFKVSQTSNSIELLPAALP